MRSTFTPSKLSPSRTRWSLMIATGWPSRSLIAISWRRSGVAGAGATRGPSAVAASGPAGAPGAVGPGTARRRDAGAGPSADREERSGEAGELAVVAAVAGDTGDTGDTGDGERRARSRAAPE